MTFTIRSLVSAKDDRFENNGVLGDQTSAAGPGSLADWLNLHFTRYNTDGFPTGVLAGSDTALTYSNSSTTKLGVLPFLGYQKNI